MFVLKLLGIGVLVTAGIAMIAFLEEKLVSGPRRRQIAERARQKLAGSGKAGREEEGA
ncbi:hypothetical protein [Geomonas propionica]|uniref:Uncharacterized protein n=1 Tax=Geomonas propionica TaxID=2798582 RepID=A0ABS0YUE0_9BACT|nr:hypothetical protein [Geomonas propionica]MBJ6801067.1 hypothetical protein [Geomonas propionica]